MKCLLYLPLCAIFLKNKKQMTQVMFSIKIHGDMMSWNPLLFFGLSQSDYK